MNKTEYVIQSFGGRFWTDLTVHKTEKEMLAHEEFLKDYWKDKICLHFFRKVKRITKIKETIIDKIYIK